MTTPIYGQRPDLQQATALAKRRVNYWVHRLPRLGPDLADAFGLRPAIAYQQSTAGTTYGTRGWAVIVDGCVWRCLMLRRNGAIHAGRWSLTDHLDDTEPGATMTDHTEPRPPAATDPASAPPDQAADPDPAIYPQLSTCRWCKRPIRRIGPGAPWFTSGPAGTTDTQCHQAPDPEDGPMPGHEPGTKVLSPPPAAVHVDPADLPPVIIPRIIVPRANTTDDR